MLFRDREPVFVITDVPKKSTIPDDGCLPLIGMTAGFGIGYYLAFNWTITNLANGKIQHFAKKIRS